jgi:eukaryotic-like serine/threonine-protein kinase
MQSPSPTYQCPRCGASFAVPSRFCGRCGALMDVGGPSDDTPLMEPGAGVSTRPGTAELALRRRASDSQDRWLGRVIDDRYRVLEIVGRGGMGVVYKVEHLRMGKVAAMKVLHPEYSRDAEVVERFRREAEAVSQLAHPNTVQVFDFGTASGALYLIMEYVRGPDLSTLIKRDGPMPFARAAPMLAQICAALAEAHALGIVHRDLKPENILVTRTHRGRDFVKILDFGLAKLSEHDDRPDVTDRGAIIGTPYYMSPEQIRGEAVDARTDVYALGSMMYRMLTGTYAFAAGTPMGVLTKHLTDPLQPPSLRAPELDISPRLDEIVARSMAKDRAARYPTIGAMLDDVEATYLELADAAKALAPALEIPETSSWQGRTTSGQMRSLVRDETDEIDYGIDSAIRLRRADLDEYERSLRRRRRVRVALVPLLLLLAASSAAYAVWLRPEPVRRAELEPNDEMDRATLIAAEQPARGYLGKRISKSEPDRDYYRVPLPAGRPGDAPRELVITAHVSALPNIDVALSLLDPTGKVLAQVSEFGVAGDEWLRRVRVSAPVFVLISEPMPDMPRLPTENVSDAYSLTVRFDEVSETRESEPNDSPSDAHALRPGQPVIAHLDRRADQDVYRFEGPAGRYRLTIDGPDELPLAWQLDTGVSQRARQAEIDLQPGDVLRLTRSDPATPGSGDVVVPRALPGAALSYTVTIQGAAGE